MLGDLIGTLSNYLYTYILVILLIAAGLYFTIRTRFVQFRMVRESSVWWVSVRNRRARFPPSRR